METQSNPEDARPGFQILAANHGNYHQRAVRLTFSSGVVASVVWGSGTYSDNNIHKPDGFREKSQTAEVGLWLPLPGAPWLVLHGGRLVRWDSLPEDYKATPAVYRPDQIAGSYSTPEEVLALLNLAANYKP